jgi:hypothetical protein
VVKIVYIHNNQAGSELCYFLELCTSLKNGVKETQCELWAGTTGALQGPGKRNKEIYVQGGAECENYSAVECAGIYFIRQTSKLVATCCLHLQGKNDGISYLRKGGILLKKSITHTREDHHFYNDEPSGFINGGCLTKLTTISFST